MTANIKQENVPAHWVDTIRFTLADIVTRGEWDDFGLFRILNRVSFVCRYHLMFVVAFKFEEAGSKGAARYDASPVISSLDPIFFNLVFEHLRKIGLISHPYKLDNFEKQPDKRIKLNKDLAREYAIDIWQTGVCILAFTLNVPKENIGNIPNMSLESVKISSALGSFIAEVLKPFDGLASSSSDYPDLLWSDRIYIPQDEALRGIRKLREANALVRAKGDWPAPLSNTQRKNIRNAVGEISRLIEDEYDQRLCKSPLLNNNLSGNQDDNFEPITNAIFISKTFDAERLRYDHYRFNVRAILPRSRLKAIGEALRTASRADFIPFDGGLLDNEFWSHVSSEDGRIEIGQNLRRPVPHYVRLFAESVLMSGTTLIKPGVFDRRAIGWIDNRKLSLAERHRALFQLCCYHFVLQLGSPVRPASAKELSIVALPFRCSGGIWMCAVYVRDNPSGPIPELIDQQRFEENALIYHSLFRESERRLRRLARAQYTDALGKLIADQTIKTAQRGKENERILCLDTVSREEFQHDMRLLTRVYPFDGVELVPRDEIAQDVVLFTKIGIESRPNEFFDRLTLHDFIDEKDNLRRLRERILLASALVGK